MLLNRLLSAVSPRALFAAEGASGGAEGGQGGGDQGAAAAAAAAAAAKAGEAGEKKPTPTMAEGGDGGAEAAAKAAAAAAKSGGLPEGFDFRAYMANGDKDAEKDLAKYADPRLIYKSLRELQTKVSKGELKAPPQALPEGATEEQKIAWRKSNGLPDSAEAFIKNLKLPDGVVLGESDKPLVEAFAKRMFESGANQGEMDRALSWYYETAAQLKATEAETDGDYHTETAVTLRTEMGPDFKANMNAFGAFRDSLPAELQHMLFSARTVDGKLLGDLPAFIKAGAAIGRALNPAAALVPPGSGDSTQSIDTQISEIEGKMYLNGKPNDAYWKDAGMQARYRELVDARETMKGRAGKAA